MKHIRKIIIFIALVISMTYVYNFGTELNKYVEADLENKAVIESASAEEERKHPPYFVPSTVMKNGTNN